MRFPRKARKSGNEISSIQRKIATASLQMHQLFRVCEHLFDNSGQIVVWNISARFEKNDKKLWTPLGIPTASATSYFTWISIWGPFYNVWTDMSGRETSDFGATTCCGRLSSYHFSKKLNPFASVCSQRNNLSLVSWGQLRKNSSFKIHWDLGTVFLFKVNQHHDNSTKRM